ncbi:MAG: transaldolase [Truepera sp.]|nr:transaldolase [Truepera sp.]
MNILLDTADRQVINNFTDHPLVGGITTNPTLLRRSGVRRNELADFVGHVLARGFTELHVQVMSATTDAMLADADTLLGFGDTHRLVIKIPVTHDGLRAAQALIREGVRVTLTAGYAAEQALWAARVGASYLAPYLGRLNDSGEDGLAVIADMQTIVEQEGSATKLLVASIRSSNEVVALAKLGVGTVTLPPALLQAMLTNSRTDEAERNFLADAAAL